MGNYYMAEFMVLSSLYLMNEEEELKEMQRDAAERSSIRAIGAEELRRSLEEEQVDQWHDTENRKIAVAAGETKTVMAGAGVDIPALLMEEKQALVELLGEKQANNRRLGAAGAIRLAEIAENKHDRLSQLEPAGWEDWALALANGFAKGVAIEEAMGGWDGSLFGIDFKGGGESMFAEEVNIPTRTEIHTEGIVPVLQGETAVSPFVTDPLESFGSVHPTPDIPGPHPVIQFPQAGTFGTMAGKVPGFGYNPVIMHPWYRSIMGVGIMPKVW